MRDDLFGSRATRSILLFLGEELPILQSTILDKSMCEHLNTKHRMVHKHHIEMS